MNERFGLWQERLPQPQGKKGPLIGGSVRVSSLSRFHTAVRVGFYFFSDRATQEQTIVQKTPHMTGEFSWLLMPIAWVDGRVRAFLFLYFNSIPRPFFSLQ